MLTDHIFYNKYIVVTDQGDAIDGCIDVDAVYGVYCRKICHQNDPSGTFDRVEEYNYERYIYLKNVKIIQKFYREYKARRKWKKIFSEYILPAAECLASYRNFDETRVDEETLEWWRQFNLDEVEEELGEVWG